MPMKNNREFVTASCIWDIEQFASLVSLNDIEITSKSLNSKSINDEWKLHVRPNACLDEDYITFYVSKTNISKQTAYDFTLSIGRPDKTPVKSYNYRCVRFVGFIGEELFLHKKSNSWILTGPIRFRCDITKIELKNDDLTHTPCFNSSVPLNLADTENLSLDLKELLRMPFHSDLTVKMGGKKMYIHKYMLYARCSNLSSEFGHRTIMDMPSSVETEINDEIFELLMHYIYTGKLRDSYVPLELFRLAERLGLSSLLRCVREHVCSKHVCSEVIMEEKDINWNLDELKFLEESSTCVHILQTLRGKQLAVQISISDGCEDEKCLDVSFKFFGVCEDNPFTLISKISLTSKDGLDAFKQDKHIFYQDEQWNFPRILYQKDKYRYNLGMCLRVEMRIYGFEIISAKSVKTKTKLLTDFQSVTDNLEDLRSCIGFLLQTAESRSNLVLLSADNKLFRVHDVIMWARWPGLKKLIEDLDFSDEVTDVQLELKLPSEVLHILLPYLYTGFIENFDREKAEILLKYSSELEYPYHLVKKSEDLLSVKYENQNYNLF